MMNRFTPSGTEIQPCFSNEMRENRHKFQEGKLENFTLSGLFVFQRQKRKIKTQFTSVDRSRLCQISQEMTQLITSAS